MLRYILTPVLLLALIWSLPTSAANNPPDSGAPARGKARYCVTIDQVPEATTCAARCAAESWVCSDAGIAERRAGPRRTL